MTNLLLSVLALGAWVALLGMLYRLSRGVEGVGRGMLEVAESLRNPDLGRLEGDVDELKLRVESLPSLWDDHEQRIKRATDRQRAYARQVAQRTQELELEGPGDIPVDDGGARENGGMQPMSQAMAAAPAQPQLDYIAAGWRRKLNG